MGLNSFVESNKVFQNYTPCFQKLPHKKFMKSSKLLISTKFLQKTINHVFKNKGISISATYFGARYNYDLRSEVKDVLSS